MAFAFITPLASAPPSATVPGHDGPTVTVQQSGTTSRLQAISPVTPRIVQGTPTSGALSVDFRDAFHRIVGGGELVAPDAFLDNVRRSTDGGQTWQLAASPTFPRTIYGLTYVRGRGRIDVGWSTRRVVGVTNHKAGVDGGLEIGPP